MACAWTLPSEGRLKLLRQDDQNHFMYAVELKIPEVFGEDGIKYKSSKHIFTENEINRACVRYYTETGETLRRKLQLGYVNVTTFVNNQGAMVTRYLVNIRTTAGVYSMLFTAREFQRSKGRFEDLSPRPTLREALISWFKKK